MCNSQSSMRRPLCHSVRTSTEALESRALLAVYVVAPSGNDNALGNASAPWATLQKAADMVKAGDTVLVRGGDYIGFDLRTDGRVDNRITFKAEDPANAPRITQRNIRTPDGINLEGADYITINGFEVRGMPRAGIRSVENAFVEVLNNYTVDNQVWGIFTGFSDDIRIEGNRTTGAVREHGIYVSNSGDRPIIRSNTIWNNRANGIHMNGDLSQGGDGIITGALVENNIIFENGLGGGSGINADGVQDSLFVNNLLYDNHASGISLYQGDGAEPSINNVVKNNTVHQAVDGRWALNITNGSYGNTVQNNILLNRHPFRGSITVSLDSLPGFECDYNVVMDRMSRDDGETIMKLADWRRITGLDSRSLIAAADALFVNWPAKDYHLKAGSPAIDKGELAFAPEFDFEGDTRPQGPGADIGADERRVTQPTPGDFNQDGEVGIADFALLRVNFGTRPAPAGFDLDGDGGVGLGDFAIFRRNFGRRSSA